MAIFEQPPFSDRVVLNGKKKFFVRAESAASRISLMPVAPLGLPGEIFYFSFRGRSNQLGHKFLFGRTFDESNSCGDFVETGMSVHFSMKIWFKLECEDCLEL